MSEWVSEWVCVAFALCTQCAFCAYTVTLVLILNTLQLFNISNMEYKNGPNMNRSMLKMGGNSANTHTHIQTCTYSSPKLYYSIHKNCVYKYMVEVAHTHSTRKQKHNITMHETSNLALSQPIRNFACSFCFVLFRFDFHSSMYDSIRFLCPFSGFLTVSVFKKCIFVFTEYA